MSRLSNSLGSRFLISLLLAMLLGWGIGEFSFQTISGTGRNVPQQIELVIPSGTAELISRGENTLNLPDDLIFLSGDVLVVKNLDSVSHQLGPLWVPAGMSASLSLEEPNRYRYSCTFQTSRALGLDVRPRVTLWVRFQGALAIGLPSGVLLALYSLVLFPLRSNAVNRRENT